MTFLQNLNQINSATSDQNLTIDGSLNSSCQSATDRSIFMSLGLINDKLFAFFCFEHLHLNSDSSILEI